MKTMTLLSNLATAVSLTIAGMCQAAETNADIFGKWKIKSFVGAAEVSALSQREVEQLIGKSVSISPQEFVFNGQTCKYPSYARSTDDAVTYFEREWRADAKELHFGKQVTIVETDCNMLYPTRKNHLIVAERGNFFEAVRTAPLGKKPETRLPRK
jgi:hypothetical protein